MTARLAVLTLAAIIAMGGLGIGIARTLDDDATAGGVEPIELRKDDSAPELVAQPGDETTIPSGDGDRTRGDDGTGGGNNTDGDGRRRRHGRRRQHVDAAPTPGGGSTPRHGRRRRHGGDNTLRSAPTPASRADAT